MADGLTTRRRRPGEWDVYLLIYLSLIHISEPTRQ